MKILVVGQNPSKKNKSTQIPFLGTRSGQTLDIWLLGIDVYSNDVDFINCTDKVDFKFDAKSIRKLANEMFKREPFLKYDKVLAVGEIASRVLSRIPVKHFKLPHPSGRNTRLNNKQYLYQQLKQCKQYLEAK